MPAHAAVEGNERVHQLVHFYRRDAQYSIAQEHPGLVLRDLSVKPCSLGVLRQILFAQGSLDKIRLIQEDVEAQIKFSAESLS